MAALNEQSIPLINLSIEGGVLATLTTDKNEEAGTLTVAEWGQPSGEYKCLAKYRGQASMGQEKKSLGVKLIDDNGEDLDAVLLGIRQELKGDNSWILDAMAVEGMRMRNRLCMDLWNDMSRLPYETKSGGRSGSQGRYVELYLDGNYRGLYCLSDKVDRKLLGLDKEKEGVVKGALYKAEYWDSSNCLADTVLQGEHWDLQYPKNRSDEAFAPLFSLINYASEAYRFLDATSEEVKAWAQEFENHFYLDNVVDYAVFLTLTAGYDQLRHNFMLSVQNATKSVRFVISPWDCDLTLAASYWHPDNSPHYDIQKDLLSTAPFNMLYYHNVLGFRDKFWSRIGELTATGALFDPEVMMERMQTMRNPLVTCGAWQREYETWKDKGTNQLIWTHMLTDGSDLTRVANYIRSNNEWLTPENVAMCLPTSTLFDVLYWQPWPEATHVLSPGAGPETFPAAAYTGTSPVTYENTNKSVATVAVDDAGQVVVTYTGAPGYAQIVASAQGSCYTEARRALRVKAASALAWTPGLPAALRAGEKFTIGAASIDPAEAISYASGNEQLATIDANTREVTLLAPGTVTITATTPGNETTEPGSVPITLNIGAAQVKALRPLPAANGGDQGDCHDLLGRPVKQPAKGLHISGGKLRLKR